MVNRAAFVRMAHVGSAVRTARRPGNPVRTADPTTKAFGGGPTANRSHHVTPARLAWAVLLLVPSLCLGDDTVEARGKYAEVAKRLDPWIAAEVETKGLPALSVALVDGDRVVWARGYGFADPDKRVPATAETAYRVGSVSKLFTDLAVMQLLEEGKLDLDVPVDRFLPGFAPKNVSDVPITPRQLMAHRSGLVREPAVGLKGCIQAII